MKLARVKFRLPIPHPALGGDSASRDYFATDADPAFEIETMAGLVRLTCDGQSRLVSLAQVMWADELPAPAAVESVDAFKQHMGGKKGKR